MSCRELFCVDSRQWRVFGRVLCARWSARLYTREGIHNGISIVCAVIKLFSSTHSITQRPNDYAQRLDSSGRVKRFSRLFKVGVGWVLVATLLHRRQLSLFGRVQVDLDKAAASRPPSAIDDDAH